MPTVLPLLVASCRNRSNVCQSVYSMVGMADEEHGIGAAEQLKRR